MKPQIITEAHRVGFDAVGFARWDAALPQINRLRKWLSSGYAEDMEYLERNPESRCDPRSLLPECKSVIVTASNYYNETGARSEKCSGLVSRYAWGDDYHEVVKSRLRKLMAYISSIAPDARCKPTVDSSPVLEKAFAVASGIGWQGKHSLVTSKQLGGYFFIGLLLTNLELEPDMPVSDRCATCTLCQDACPTNALSTPYVLAANKCISYLTTARNEPPTTEESTHGWLYGCDICQDVCPYNSKLSASTEPRFTPKPRSFDITTAALLEMDEAQFNSRFDGTVIRRRKLWRMQEQVKRIADTK